MENNVISLQTSPEKVTEKAVSTESRPQRAEMGGMSQIDAAQPIFDNLVWMNSADAAQYLRKSVGALRTAVCRGQLRARKWRRRLYFRRQELDRLIDSSEQMGGI